MQLLEARATRWPLTGVLPDAQLNRVEQDLQRVGDQIERRLRLPYAPIVVRRRPGHLQVTCSGFAGTIAVASQLVDVMPRYLSDRHDWKTLLGKLVALDLGVPPMLFDGGSVNEGSRFVDYLAIAFAAAVRRASVRGPILTYQSHETSADQLRGRINVTRQLRALLKGSAHIEQTVTELTSDNPQHALLSWAKRHLQQNASPRIASYVRDATRELPFSKAPLTRGTAQRAVRTRRQDRHWGPALELASALYLYQGVDDGMAGPNLPGMVFNTWQLFESLVRHVVQLGLVHHPNLRYGGRGRKVWLRSNSVRPRPLLPDCLVQQGTGCAAVIDAKNKTGRPLPADLYQMRTYVTHYGSPVGVLVYPGTTQMHAVEVGIRFDDVLGPRILTWSLDVAKAINAHPARINCAVLLA